MYVNQGSKNENKTGIVAVFNRQIFNGRFNNGKNDGRVMRSVAVLAEISLKPPRKIFIFIIKKYIYRIKVSKNKLI